MTNIKSPQTILTCTVNLHKRLYGIKFKNRASRAVFEIKKFVQSITFVKQIRFDPHLNNQIWKSGSRHTPLRIRIKIIKQIQPVMDKTNATFVFVCSDR